jgi:hypothetical protein
MFRSLISIFLFLFSLSAFAERPRLAFGLGLEARLQQEVNPDYAEVKTLGQIFAQSHFEKWSLHYELAYEKRESNSGALMITSRSYNSGIWGRYRFVNERRWTPFVSSGVGAYFDKVTSRWGVADERKGIRPYWGLGGGVSAVYWEYLLLEVEARGMLVQERIGPLAAALLRIGVYF